jgi:hypothetical protein
LFWLGLLCGHFTDDLISQLLFLSRAIHDLERCGIDFVCCIPVPSPGFEGESDTWFSILPDFIYFADYVVSSEEG